VDEIQALKDKGLFKGEIDPDLVAQFHSELNQREQVRAVLEEVNPTLEKPEAAYRELKQIWETDPSLTVAQVKAIATEVYGSAAARKLAKKIQRSNPDQGSRPAPRRSSDREPLTFDDLE
jgi:3-polyprenyl-4-hydroxybenzoate decarboxylase